MTEVAHTPHSRWSRLADALRGRDASRESAADTSDRTVSFAELVWSHYKRQEEVADGIVKGPWEKHYRRQLSEFKAEHGEIVDAYWCRHEASAVALTERPLPRRLSNLYQRDPILQLHAATAWRTEDTPAVASALHRWEAVAIRASEILRDSTENIVLRRIFAASTRLLALVDREEGKRVGQATLDKVLKEENTELAEVTDYYERAGDNLGRILYFRGMLVGTASLGIVLAVVLLVGWWRDWLDPRDKGTYTIFVTFGMGAVGAVLSVMTRMAKRKGFSLDFEVGRKSVRRLGRLRPWIGALFALALYLALKSSLVEFFSDVEHGIYYYATIGFFAGFSERWAKVMLGRADDESEAASSTKTHAGSKGGEATA